MATFKSDYHEFQIYVPNGDEIAPELGVSQTVKFKRGTFETENEELIEFLENHSRFDINFYRIDSSNNSSEGDWKDNLKSYDKPDSWSEATVEKLKEGEDIYRCEYECGFATTTPSAKGSHENSCQNNPDNYSKDEE